MSTPPSSTALIHIFSSKGLPDSLTYLPNSHQSYLTTMQIWLLLQSPTLPRKEGASSFTWHVRPSMILPLLTFPASLVIPLTHHALSCLNVVLHLSSLAGMTSFYLPPIYHLKFNSRITSSKKPLTF